MASLRPCGPYFGRSRRPWAGALATLLSRISPTSSSAFRVSLHVDRLATRTFKQMSVKEALGPVKFSLRAVVMLEISDFFQALHDWVATVVDQDHVCRLACME